MPITLCFFSQMLSPSILGLIVSTILFFLEICLIIHSRELLEGIYSIDEEVGFRFLFVVGL